MKTHQSKTGDSGTKTSNSQPFFSKKNQGEESTHEPFFAEKNQASFFQPSLIQAKLNDAQNSSSEGLDKETKPELENFLGHSLANIKIHNNSASHESSNLIQAKAYTTGNHIFLGSEVNSMPLIQRKSLLAHEAVHTIQQRSFSPTTIQAKSIIDSPQSPHEQEADNIANVFTQSQNEEYRSSALQMRSNMRISPITNPSIQRSIKTWGGEWDTDQYDLITPATAKGARGVDIKLKFSPGVNSDAELIGLTQSVQTNVGGNFSYVDKRNEDLSIKSKDAISINTGKGETDEGTAIDRLSERRNPIYGTLNTRSGGGSENDLASYDAGGNNQFGYRYTDKTGLKVKDAWLFDGPRRPNAEKDSRHIFETTALAIKGTQNGTYYGSVRWGWRTDNKGVFTKLPLTVVSQGVPSSSFMKAAEIWNPSKTTPLGEETVNLPIVDVMVTKNPITLIRPVPMVNIALPTGTRLQVLQGAPLLNSRVKVVDGPHTGMVGEINQSEWTFANVADERP